MTSKRHRHFPILDKDGLYKGMISRRNLLGARGKAVIMVDHNEKGQAVDGIEGANIQEIIDHHKLAAVSTISPVYFRNQPLGCTATIIYQMYLEAGVEIEPKIAGLLCSAIISDTLLFRSPTCTAVAAASNLKGKTDQEIFYQDFKRFEAGKISFGVGQISSVNAEELSELKERLLPYLKVALKEHGTNMMFFMLTNILTESTELLCEGAGAEQLIIKAFHVDGDNDDGQVHGQVISLPGVVSRKKQLVPGIMIVEE